jgi:hypothetical protein
MNDLIKTCFISNVADHFVIKANLNVNAGKTFLVH